MRKCFQTFDVTSSSIFQDCILSQTERTEILLIFKAIFEQIILTIGDGGTQSLFQLNIRIFKNLFGPFVKSPKWVHQAKFGSNRIYVDWNIRWKYKFYPDNLSVISSNHTSNDKDSYVYDHCSIWLVFMNYESKWFLCWPLSSLVSWSEYSRV